MTDDRCAKCGHDAGHHGMTFCEITVGTGKRPRCDCDGWSTTASDDREIAHAVALEREAVIRHIEQQADAHRKRRDRNLHIDSPIAASEHHRYDDLATAADEIARGAHNYPTTALAADDV